VHYRGDAFLFYDLDAVGERPKIIHLSGNSYAATPPGLLTGPGVIGRREEWQTYCGPHTRVAEDSAAMIGGDVLALWAEESLLRGESLSLQSSPLVYGLPPDFKKLPSA
jgi:hypothetical protein